MLKKRDDGYILITCLLMVLVLTVVGLAAIGTSTMENIVSWNIRVKETNLAEADGCAELSTAVLRRVLGNFDTVGYNAMVNDPDLFTELSSRQFWTDPNDAAIDPIDRLWDVVCNIGGQTVTADIDMMYSKYIEGSSIEFAAGYEGVGKGASSGSIIYYRINSYGRQTLNTERAVGTIYRYKP